MSGYDIDRTLADWFETDAQAAVPTDGLDHALDGVRRRRPRPAWLAGPGSHWGWTATPAGSSVGVRVFPRSACVGRPRSSWSSLLGVLLGGALLVGARLLEPPPLPAARLGHLAYAVDGDIFVADWDGQNPVRIADGLPGGQVGLRVGRLLGRGTDVVARRAVSRLSIASGRRSTATGQERDTIPTVLLSDPAGNVVAEVPGVGWLIPWSPDSTRFATWLDLYPSTRIGVYGVDGAAPGGRLCRRRCTGTTTGDYDPMWSPDGESILILDHASRMTCTSGMQMCQNARQVWEVPIDGGAPRQIPPDDPRSHWAQSALARRDASRLRR